MNTFHIQRQIYYHHTDVGGVVYYKNYLCFVDESIVDLLRAHGIVTSEYHDKGVRFATVHIEVRYKSPARYGDTISVYPCLTRVGNSSLHFSVDIKRSGLLLVSVQLVWVCIGKDLQKSALPDAIRQISSAFCIGKE